MVRALRCLVNIGLLLTAIFNCRAASADRVKVGFVIAQTGSAAWWGKHIVQGLRIAERDQREPRSVEFLIEDDGFSAKTAVTASTKLLIEDKVQALVTFGGGSSAAVAELAERRGVPHIGIAGTETFIRDKKFVYRLFMSNQQQMDLLTEEGKTKDLKTLAVIATEQETMIRFQELFVERNKSTVILTERVQPGDNDMTSLATKIKKANPDGITLFVNPPNLAPLARTLRSLKYTGEFLAGVNAFNPPEIRASQGALLGVSFPAPDDRGDSARKFASQYEKEYSESPASESFYGYDAASLLIAATESGDIQGYLSKLKAFRGSCGNYARTGQSFDVPAILKKITEGAIEAPDGVAQ